MRPYKALLGSVAVAVAVAVVVPETPSCSQRLPEAPRGSQTLPVLGVNCVTKAVFDGPSILLHGDAPRGSRRGPRGSQRLSNVSKK